MSRDDREMDRPVDCQVFADQLEALVRGDLPEDGMRQFRLHAHECSECGMQLRVQEHLVEPRLLELEARVPDKMVEGMWDAVEAGLPASGEAGLVDARAQFRPRAPWLVPTLAAATIVLLFSTGFLYWKTTRLQTRTQALTQQVEDQRYWMAELEMGGADPVARTAALAGRSPWSRALSRQDEITLRSLRSLLARVPADRVILSRSQMDGVLRSRVPLSPPPLREILGRIPGTDGVTAAELLTALDELEMSPETALPTADLIALLS